MPDTPEKTQIPRPDGYRPPLTIGASVGKFRLLELLGEGGMGMVFRAEDQKLRREVALKLMKADAARVDQARKLFLREARTAASVRSDKIVTILEADEYGALPYIAMELLYGESLDKYLSRSPLPPVPFTISVGHQVATGLHAAHTHTTPLIHRDIKPSNVWLRDRPGPAGVDIRLLDFGLARAIGRDTLSGGDVSKLLGTPAYMSPEQWRGKGIDHQSDLFGLGVMLYEMTTGTRPYHGENAAELMFNVCHGPDRPRRVDVDQPHIPAELASIIADLIAREKSERMPTAMAVMRRLEGIRIAGVPLVAPVSVSAGVLPPVSAVPMPRLADPSGPVYPMEKATPTRPRPAVTPTPQAQVPTRPRNSDETEVPMWRSTQPQPSPLVPWVTAFGVVLLAAGVWGIVLTNNSSKKTVAKATTPAEKPPEITGGPTNPGPPDGKAMMLPANPPDGKAMMPPANPPPTPTTPGPSSHGGVKASAVPYAEFAISPGTDAATIQLKRAALAEKLGVPAEFRVDLGGSVGMDFVLVPPGWFQMGTAAGERDVLLKLFPDLKKEEIDRETPDRRVDITRPMYVAATEVTRGQFRRFLADKQTYEPDHVRAGGGGGWDPSTKKMVKGPDKRYSWEITGWPATDSHPVVNVTWLDATTFANWVSGKTLPKGFGPVRLPREAEWEFACRAGTKSRYPNGSDDPASLVTFANVADASFKKAFPEEPALEADDTFAFTAPVKSFPANPFGLYDMIGNAWELCADRFDPDVYHRLGSTDPFLNPADDRNDKKRAVRGCSWNFPPQQARPASRDGTEDESLDSDCGFRLVIPLSPTR